ncbi:MAG: serine hydrolase [Phycisphaerales bacterium]|jgi:CubicO group peptidase (beta-lactamase class C family)
MPARRTRLAIAALLAASTFSLAQDAPQQFRDEARAYEQQLAQDPTDGQAAFRAAYAWHAAGDYERAIPAHRRAAEFAEFRPAALYNLACAQALMGKHEDAIASLYAAIDAGFDRIELMEEDSDLHSLRNRDDFKAALTRARAIARGDDLDVPDLTWDTIDQRMKAEEAAGFSGVLLVVRDGSIAHHAGYGLADRDTDRPVDSETIFAIGSVPIDFTFVCILQLINQGKLDRHDPITKFFDDVPGDKRSITLDHLMNGESGLPDFHDIPTDRDPDHGWIDREEAVRRIMNQQLLFEPGTDSRHSHSAWGLLAAVLEIASGQSYQESTQEHIYEPANMPDTGFFGKSDKADRIAIGYGARSDGETNAPPYWGQTSWLVMGSGGQVSTARDLNNFLSAVHDGTLAGPDAARTMFGDATGMAGAGDMYGYEVRMTFAPADRFILISNSANLTRSDHRRRFGALARDLHELVQSSMNERHAATALPAEERERRAMAWVHAVGERDPDAYVRVNRQYRPPAEDEAAQAELDATRRGQHADFYSEFGMLQSIRVITNTPTLVEIEGQSPNTDAWITFGFTFQPVEPHHITGVSIGIDGDGDDT